MEYVTVTLEPLGKQVRVRKGTSLTDLLHGYGAEFPCGGRGRCGKCSVRLLEGEIRTDDFHREKLKYLGLPPDRRLACMSLCEEELLLEVGQFEMILLADESVFDFEPGKGTGVAIDLGTSTVVAQLLDLRSGRVLAAESGLNPQRRYGHDLISRLEWALEHGTGKLQQSIREFVRQMVAKLMEGRKEALSRVALVGNTVMQHLFCGSDIRSLSYYPFEPADPGLKKFTSGELDWSVPCEEIIFHPSIGSFVGSDILAGILATRIYQREEISVLVDLGTNGEIVVGNRDRILCASTAAGPAFEGARISMGMTAITGAISSVMPVSGGWDCRVIGNTEPRGICGSGLIDAVAVLLEGGYLSPYGLFQTGTERITIAGDVGLTQKDIQEFLLAKAAIAAGVEILMERMELGPEDISDIYLAGAFGNYVSFENAVRTGLLSFRTEQMHKLGNTALIGAKMLLFPRQGVPESILGITSHVSLESEMRFQEKYVRQLKFNLPGHP